MECPTRNAADTSVENTDTKDKYDAPVHIENGKADGIVDGLESNIDLKNAYTKSGESDNEQRKSDVGADTGEIKGGQTDLESDTGEIKGGKTDLESSKVVIGVPTAEMEGEQPPVDVNTVHSEDVKIVMHNGKADNAPETDATDATNGDLQGTSRSPVDDSEALQVSTEPAEGSTTKSGGNSAGEQVIAPESSPARNHVKFHDDDVAAIPVSASDETDLKQTLTSQYKKSLASVAASKSGPRIDFDRIFTPITVRGDLEKQVMDHKPPNPKLRKQGPKGQPELLESYDDVFYKGTEMLEDIFLLGKAGIGKSLFTWQMVHFWCKVQTNEPTCDTETLMAKFEFMFHVSCRYAANSDSLSDMVIKQLCGDSVLHARAAKQILASKDKRCVILVDGLDEWAASASEVDTPFVRLGVPSREGLENCVVLYTSGPLKIEVLYRELGFTCRVLEVVGLDKEGILDMILHLLLSLDEPYATYSVDYIWVAIKKMKMKEVAKIPLMLTTLIVTWHENGHQLERSTCVNYAGMLESLIHRTGRVPDLGPGTEETPGGPGTAIPPCFAKRKLCVAYWPLILKLAKVAFESLLGHDKEILVFSKPDLVERLGETELQDCLKFGILVQSQVTFETSHHLVNISFLHKNFQEFLAALHMSGDNFDVCFENFKEHCRTLTDVFDRRLITICLCGFDPYHGSTICQYLATLAEEDTTVAEYRAAAGSLFPFSRLYSPTLTIVQLEELMLTAVVEAECHLEFYTADKAGGPPKPPPRPVPAAAAKPKVRKKKSPFRLFFNCVKASSPDPEPQEAEAPVEVEEKVQPEVTDDTQKQLARMFSMTDVFVDRDLSPEACSFLYRQTTSHASTITSLVFSGDTETPARVLIVVPEMVNLERLHVVSSLTQVERDIKFICRVAPHLKHLKSLGIQVGKFRQQAVPESLVRTLLATLGTMPDLVSVYLGWLGTEVPVGKVKAKLSKKLRSAPPAPEPAASTEECQLPSGVKVLSLNAVSFPRNLNPLFPSSVPMTSLTAVDIKGIKISHTQVQSLCECLKVCTSLEKLLLSGLCCVDCNLGICNYDLDLCGLPELRSLDLEYLDVHIVKLGSPKLAYVRLWELSVPGAVGSILVSLPQSEFLVKVVISNCSMSYDDVTTLISILQSCQQLEELDLQEVQCDDSQGIQTANMFSLREIELYRVKMSPSSWRSFIKTLPLPPHEIEVWLGECNVDKETENEIWSSPYYRDTYLSDTEIEFHTVPQKKK